eukprot:TRINITY_DN10247_c0_g1_i1.p1 TRINITY_DN10247_c0_g1~~TRINITY_DN10247_c0_g1_i1.p1  ORF type:complete len:140 (+),score=20.21 TRINITY_DN10247_c0_g1_i1:3-422(+)
MTLFRTYVEPIELDSLQGTLITAPTTSLLHAPDVLFKWDATHAATHIVPTSTSSSTTTLSLHSDPVRCHGISLFDGHHQNLITVTGDISTLSQARSCILNVSKPGRRACYPPLFICMERSQAPPPTGFKLGTYTYIANW